MCQKRLRLVRKDVAGMYLLDCIMYVKMVAIDGKGKGRIKLL